jgi:hypothetical protein
MLRRTLAGTAVPGVSPPPMRDPDSSPNPGPDPNSGPKPDAGSNPWTIARYSLDAALVLAPLLAVIYFLFDPDAFNAFLDWLMRVL